MRHFLRAIVVSGLLVGLLASGAASAASPVRVQSGESAVVWSDRGATGTDELAKIVLSAPAVLSPMATGTRNTGCEIRGLNALGWTLYRYTLYQTFKYDTVANKITYYPTPSYSTEGNWSWVDSGSTNGVKNWITSPKSAYTQGQYKFERNVQDLHESRSGWVRVDIRSTGAFWCSQG